MNMTVPNFLIVGAAKAGTTSLHHYLKQHPDIFMPEGPEERSLLSYQKVSLDTEHTLRNIYEM